MQISTDEILISISKRNQLDLALDSLIAKLPNPCTSTRYSATLAMLGKDMKVSMPAINMVALAECRPIWGEMEWRGEYVFYAGGKDIKVEVFRFYLNDQGQVEDANGKIFESEEIIGFCNFVCREVYVGTLRSSLFAATPTNKLGISSLG